MPPPVEVKGLGADVAQSMLQGPPGQIAHQAVHTFDVDNKDGLYTGYQKGILQMEWPGMDRDEAKAGLIHYLETIKDPTLTQSTPTSRAVQRGLEEAGPSLAGAASLNPLTAGALRAGTYLATRGTQALLEPEAYRAQTEGNWGNVLGETGMQGLEGAATAWLANPASRVLGMGGRKMLTGSAAGHTMTPDEARILSPGKPATLSEPATPPGPFEAGAELTGQPAYPRLSQFIHSKFTDFSDTVALALGSAGRTRAINRQLGANLNAYSTQMAQTLTQATDPRDLARALNQMTDMSGKEIYAWQQGLWQAADARALAETGGQLPLVQTTPDINFLRRSSPLGGQRLTVMDRVEEAVKHELEARPLLASFAQSEKEGASFTQGGVTQTGMGTTSARATPRGTSAQVTTGEGASSKKSVAGPPSAPVPSSSGLVDAQGNPVMVPGPPSAGGTMTQEASNQTTQQVQEQAPLGGRLHTFDPETGQLNEHITLGDAMALRSSIGSVIGQSSTIGLQSAEVRAAKAWYANISKRIDDVLEGIHPELRTMYDEARNATSTMYAKLNSDSILKTLDTIKDSPEALNTYFFANGGLTHLDGLREALSLVNHVPGTQIDGARWFDINITPRLRYQVLWNASQTAAQEGMSLPLDNLARAASSRPDIQELIANKQLVALKPGALSSMEQAMGKEQFEGTMGGADIAQQFKDLDVALQYNQRQSDPAGQLSILMMQTGGASRMSNAIGALTLGAAGLGGGASFATGGSPLASFVSGVGGGGLVLLTPMAINFLASTPKVFRTLVEGIRTGDAPFVQRLIGQVAVHAARKAVQDAVQSGEPPPPIRVPWSPSGQQQGQPGTAPGSK